jgi:hypothetical protein
VRFTWTQRQLCVKAAAPKRASGKMKVVLRRAEGAFFLSSQTFATKSAKSRREQLQQFVRRSQTYSITSSAMASTPGGMFKLSVLAVLRLMINSNLVGCRTGRSAGFSPLRIRPT